MPVLEARGHGGQLAFDGQYVTITRKGFLARATVGKGEKRIHVRNITSVQWKPAGILINGFIQFGVSGGTERRSRFGHQTSDAAKDENSVVFTKQQQPQFEAVRAAVEAAVAQERTHQAASETPEQRSLADELAKLAALRGQGVLGEAEFEAAKARLLNH